MHNDLIGKKSHKTKKENKRKKKKKKKKEGNTGGAIYTTTQTPSHVENRHKFIRKHNHPAKVANNHQ